MSGRPPESSPCKCRQALNRAGFTLIEVMFALLFLSMMIMAVSGLYYSAQRSLHAQTRLLPLDSRLRGRMEEVVSRTFDAIADGSEIITIDGDNFTMTWTVTQPDLDSDSTPEPTAKRVTVTIDGKSLSTLVIDSRSKVGKI